MDSIWDGLSLSFGKDKDTTDGDDDGNGGEQDCKGSGAAVRKGGGGKRSGGGCDTTPTPTKPKKVKPASPVTATTPSKRTKEVSCSESVLLQCQQTLRASLAPDTMCSSMNDSAIKALVAKGNTRLSATLVNMYAGNGDDTPQMEMMLSLQTVIKKLDKLLIAAPYVRT